MTDDPRQMIRRAWWRFFVLAFIGGTIVNIVLSMGARSLLGALSDDRGPWQSAIAGLVAFTGMFGVFYYSFREALRAMLSEMRADRPVDAARRDGSATPRPD